MQKRFAAFIGLSVLLHLGLMYAAFGLEFVSRGRRGAEIYEVSIVASPPAVTARGNSPAVSRSEVISQGRKTYVRREGLPSRGVEAIGREKTHRGKVPTLKPSEIEPPALQEEAYELPALEDLVATGDSLPGGSAPAGGALDVWLARVRDMVDANWKLPPEVSFLDANLKTTYELRISREGDLLARRLMVSSGNRPYDRSVLLALERVKHLPPPPLAVMAGKQWELFVISFSPPLGVR